MSFHEIYFNILVIRTQGLRSFRKIFFFCMHFFLFCFVMFLFLFMNLFFSFIQCLVLSSSSSVSIPIHIIFVTNIISIVWTSSMKKIVLIICGKSFTFFERNKKVKKNKTFSSSFCHETLFRAIRAICEPPACHNGVCYLRYPCDLSFTTYVVV